MGHLERGEKNVSFSSILRIADALNVTLSELFSGLGAGEPASLPEQSKQGRPQSTRGGELNCHEVLKEIAILERSIRKLKQAALAHKGKPPVRSEPRKSKATQSPKP